MREEQNQNEMIMDLIEIQADDFLIAGAVLIAIGTTFSALGITNVFLTRSQQGAEGVVIGKGIESVGNVFQVVGKEKQYSIEQIEPRFSGIIGSSLQAIGNAGSAVVVQEGLKVGLFSFSETRDEEENKKEEKQSEESVLEEEALRRIIGLYAVLNAIQGSGAFIEGYSISRLPPFATQQIEATGDYLTSLGAFIEATGLTLELAEKELEGVLLEVIGAWIQVGAASLGLYALTTEGALHQQEFDEKYRYSYRRYTT